MLKRYKLLLDDGTWTEWRDGKEPITEKYVKGLMIEETITVELFKKLHPELAKNITTKL